MTTLKDKTAIRDLYNKGLITPSRKFIPKSIVPKKVPSLTDVRKRLAKIKGSLSTTIAEIRAEE